MRPRSRPRRRTAPARRATRPRRDLPVRPPAVVGRSRPPAAAAPGPQMRPARNSGRGMRATARLRRGRRRLPGGPGPPAIPPEHSLRPWSGAVATELAPLVGELAAMLHEEAALADEFVLLNRQDPGGQGLARLVPAHCEHDLVVVVLVHRRRPVRLFGDQLVERCLDLSLVLLFLWHPDGSFHVSMHGSCHPRRLIYHELPKCAGAAFTTVTLPSSVLFPAAKSGIRCPWAPSPAIPPSRSGADPCAPRSRPGAGLSPRRYGSPAEPAGNGPARW